MTIQAQSADGVMHQFPDGTDTSIINRVMKDYAQKQGGGQAPQQGEQPKPQGWGDSMLASAGKGFLGEIGRGAYGLEQAAGHGLESVGAKTAGRFLEKRAEKGTERLDKETSSPNHPYINEAGRLGGAVVFPTPAGKGALGHAVAGGVSALSQPVPQGEDYWSTKLKQLATGAGLAGGIGGVGQALEARAAAKALQKIDPEKKMLLDAKVRLTPGQMGGERANAVEQKLASKVGIGDAIASARKRAMDDFRKATVEKALAPIGQKVSDKITDVHGMLQEASQHVSTAYTQVLQHMAFKPDAQMANGIQNIIKKNGTLPQGVRKQFNDFIKIEMQEPLAQKGFLTGPEMNHMDSVIGQRAKEFMQSLDPNQKRLGMAFKGLQEEFRDNIARVNPAMAPQLSKVRQSFAMMERVKSAANNRVASLGEFTPTDLLRSIKSADGSIRRTAFSHGDSMLQPWATAGQRHIGNTVPDSGTAGRMQYDNLTKLVTGLTLGGAYKVVDAATRAGQKNPGGISRAVGSGIDRIATPLTKALTSGQ